MQLDLQNIMSDEQTLVTTFTTALLSDKSIDLGAAGVDGLGNTVIKDLGRGNVPHLLVQIVTAVESLGSATVTFELISATDAALTGSVTVLDSRLTIAKATLVAGYQVRLQIPHGITQRYLGCRYTINTADTTAGKVTAGLVAVAQTNPSVIA